MVATIFLSLRPIVSEAIYVEKKVVIYLLFLYPKLLIYRVLVLKRPQPHKLIGNTKGRKRVCGVDV